MENIENKIKERLSHIAPSKELFNKTMEEVTKDNLNRNTILKGAIPSPYKSTYSIFVKKITYIGLPVIALVATYIIFINTGVSNKIEVQNDLPTIAQNVENNTPANDIKVAELENNVSPENQSVDSIISDIISDADDEALLAINDSSDNTFINSELSQYDSLNQNTYEEII